MKRFLDISRFCTLGVGRYIYASSLTQIPLCKVVNIELASSNASKNTGIFINWDNILKLSRKLVDFISEIKKFVASGILKKTQLQCLHSQPK